jgi:hypothetical protein
MSPAGFEPAIPGSEQPQTHALDRAATRIAQSNCNTNDTSKHTQVAQQNNQQKYNNNNNNNNSEVMFRRHRRFKIEDRFIEYLSVKPR